MSTKLKFSVVSCTSEDPEFPVSELLRPGPACKGWLSARFQDYPQAIIFQFNSSVFIKQLQFLSHSSKISSKIEIFTYMPENLLNVPPVQMFKWRRLGYLSLDPNEKSGFKARELKSVFIDAKAAYLKIALHKCHVNQFNMFNQVGLIAINVLGEEVDEKMVRARQGEFMEIDPQTSEKLKSLVALKERAVSNEDFDEAKRIREAIDRLRVLSQQLFVLEERKKTAIANEDYDSAKVLKIEIDRIRNSVLIPGESARPATAVQGGNGLHPRQGMQVMQSMQGMQGMTRPSSRPQYPPPQTRDNFQRVPSEMNERNVLSFNERNEMFGRPDSAEQFIRPERSQASNRNDSGDRVRGERQGYTDPYDDRPISTAKFSAYDEQVIPSMKNSKALDSQNPEEDVSRPSSPEPISQNTKRLCEPFIHILTDYLCKKLFSKSWHFREECLTEIQNELSQGEDSQLFQDLNPQQTFSGCLAAVRFTISDKVSQVSHKSMSLLIFIIKTLRPGKSYIRGEVPEYLNQIQLSLIDKIGDVNSKVRETAELAFLALGKSELIGVQAFIQIILKQNKDKPLQAKQMTGRINLLIMIVNEFRIDNQMVPLNPIVEFAVQGYLNSNGEVKTAGQELLAQIFGCIGQKLLQILDPVLRPAQMDSILKVLKEIEISNYQDSRGVAASKQGNKGSSYLENPIPQSRGKPQPQEPLCNFCGKMGDSFSNPDFLDLHYWKSCPMLVACLQCSQVVEILHLNSHMLKECELRELVGQCPRCKEAIHLDELDMHIAEQACLPFRPASKSSRCPLCHDDVDAGASGWLKHILTEGCPNNDRNSY